MTNDPCTCKHGDWLHGPHGCEAQVPPYVEGTMGYCPCAHEITGGGPL
jgi:hypothetical protein